MNRSPAHRRVAFCALLLSLAGTALAAAASPPWISDQREMTFGDKAVRLWTVHYKGTERVYSSLSADGLPFDEPRLEQPELLLRYATFDPLAGSPAMPARLAQPEEGDGAYVVQFHSRILPGYAEAVQAAGGRIGIFLANNAYIVEMPEAARAQLLAHPAVRAIRRYQPAFKIDPDVLLARFNWDVRAGKAGAPLTLARTEDRPVSYNIMVLQRGLAHKQLVADAITKAGGVVQEMIPEGFMIRASLNSDQLAAAAAQPGVLYIDPWSPPESDMALQRSMGGANFIETTLGYTGTGVRGEVLDAGVLGTHTAFATRPPIMHNAANVDSHGTATFGIIFGSGAGNAAGRGMAPGAQGIFADYDLMTNRYTETADLITPTYQAVFQSNSWGSAVTTAYTTTSADMDDILYINDILVCQSQSNTGNQTSRPQAWAKNVVSIGGINMLDTSALTDDNWNGASIGPASDGRIKPDLCNSYDLVLTTTSTSTTAYTSTFGGTSAATPITAGHFALFFQMWHNGIFGNPTSTSVFASRPHMSTAKALMINTAKAYSFAGSTANLSRFKQGWGLPDLQNLYTLRGKMLIVNETEPLSVGQSKSYTVTVAPGEPALRATMVFTDTRGNPSSTIARINDLSLRVTSPTGLVYAGNSSMTSGNVTTSGGALDTLNSVENVWITSPAAGTWTVQVIATDVNTDARAETPGVNADFALVVSGVVVRCSVADIVSVGGLPPPDGLLTGDDFNAFIAAFAGADPLADIVAVGGLPPADGLVTGDDFNAFIAAFATGCP